MILQDIYDQLATGELRQLAMGGGNDENAVAKADFRKFLPSIQLGLTELHKRFLLKEAQFHVDLIDLKQTYVLTKEYAQSTGGSATKYIDDTERKFNNDLMKVERIYGTYLEKEYEIPLNQVGNGNSIRTTSYNTLLIPNDPEEAPWLAETTRLRVVYRADHEPFDTAVANAAPSITEVSLPMSHLQPLLYFIASRIMNPVGMTETFHEGNNFASKYEMACQQLENYNMSVDSDAENNGLERGGWV